MAFSYTDEQKNVIKTFMQFMGDPKERFMIIQGAAGTGKTTMIKGIVDTMRKQYKLMNTLLCKNSEDEFKIVLSATTNKAAAVLCELAGNMDVKTIHSTLGLSLKRDFQSGNEYLVKNRRWESRDNTILILDEASMLDNDTFKHLNDTLIGKSKAVLIGDVFQLAPIKQKQSTMQEMLSKIPTVTMNKVLRHSGPILQTATLFREVVETLNFQDIPLSDKVIHLDGPAFLKEMEKTFTSPNYSPRSAKVLSWSNERVQLCNNYLRNLRGLGEGLEVGETVVSNNFVMSNGRVIPVDSEVTITNVEPLTEQEGISGNWITLDGLIRAFMPINYNEAKGLMKKLAKAANAENKPAKKSALWKRFYDIKDTWLDLRSQYASTVHKSQGSTYDEVFLDLWDIGRCNSPTDTARMLYVGISRARNRVILSGELPEKYQGKQAA